MKFSSFDRRWLVPFLGAGVLGMLAGAAAPVLAASSGVDDELLAMQHEAELQSGEKLLIAYHRNKESNYRVCIPEQPGDVRVKVIHDGEVTEVLDGTCETVSGRHIDVMADSKIPAGEDLVLKFGRVKPA
jgi:hypothetical protein